MLLRQSKKEEPHMTFEEFFNCCTFGFKRLYEPKDVYSVEIRFCHPSYRTWHHRSFIDAELFSENSEEAKRIAASSFYNMLQGIHFSN